MSQDTNLQILHTLQAIWAELRDMSSKLDHPQTALGFGMAPTPQRIYVNQGEGYSWYFWDHNEQKPLPIAHDALTGVITDLKADNSKQYKGEAVWKLLVDIQADRPYRIESGVSTVFSKGLMLAIASLTPAQLLQPLTITVTPGEENVVFCRLYIGNERVKVDWPEQDDKRFWRQMLNRAIANVQAATGQSQSDQPQAA